MNATDQGAAERPEIADRAVLMSHELMERLVVRDADGNRLRWDWGKRGADGFYSPTITVDTTDNLLADAKARVEALPYAFVAGKDRINRTAALEALDPPR